MMAPTLDDTSFDPNSPVPEEVPPMPNPVGVNEEDSDETL